MTKRSEAYRLVGLLVEAAERLAKAQAEFDDAQAAVYTLLHETFPLPK